MNDILSKLSAPFAPEHVTWKPGSTTKDGAKCMAMAYADLRAYQERLDELCGLDWSVEYQPWGDRRIIARLTIHGVTRASTGEMDAQDEKNNMGGTVAEAQAMKRAAAQFGLGRYLYNLPSVWVAYDSQARKISKAGQDELDNRYRTWYAKTVAKQTEPVSRQVDATTGEIMQPEAKADNPFDDSTPYYVRDWNQLTGKAYDLVKWVAALHKNSDRPATSKQYQYLTGIVDALTGKQHNYVLSVLCQTQVDSTNMPGAKVASALLELLPATKKEGDEEVANPKYRADIAELITGIAKAVQPVVAA